jgi:hypothetical protein
MGSYGRSCIAGKPADHPISYSFGRKTGYSAIWLDHKCGNFFEGWWDLVFAGGFGENGWVGRGVLVVKLWWIAGKSW